MLEAVVVAARDDLILAGTPGLVHIKYRLADNQSFANLQVWTSETRGRWLLVCEYPGVVSAAGSSSLAFSNGYRSQLLTHFLNFVMEHQSVFARAPELNRDSLVQVQLPNEDEKLRALRFLNEVQTPEVLHEPTALATGIHNPQRFVCLPDKWSKDTASFYSGGRQRHSALCHEE